MRAIKTCVIKLIVDSDDPESLRGKLHLVGSDDEFSFRDERSLLELLKQVTRPPSESPENLFGLDEKGDV